MTRRLAWRVPKPVDPSGEITTDMVSDPSPWQRVRPGDRLWVRESAYYRPDATVYAADDRPGECMNGWGRKRPSIHMYRWASRLTLVVTAARIERLQEIGEADAKAEGARHFDDIKIVSHGPYGKPCRWSMENPPSTDHCLSTPRFAFANYWNKLHGLGSWAADPECVVLTFAVHNRNIDAMVTP